MTNNGKANSNSKGKAPAGKDSSGKRKVTYDEDKTGKKRNRNVVQFFEDEAADDSDEDSDDFSDFSEGYEDEFDTLSAMNEPPKGQSSTPFVPKQELVDEEEFDRLMEERVNSMSFRYAGDEFEDKPMEDNSLHHALQESIPTIWKVKCTVGRERLSAICLMQKFVHLKSLDTKMQIISAFAVDHVKGSIYIEAERQYDINQACYGINGIYATRVQPVPRNEVFHLFSVKIKKPEISEGMWARVKGGIYKGDLAQVVAVNNTSKKVTVKLIPRIDLQVLAAKFGGGCRQKTAVPAPRLISSSELEEFRPLIQIKHDRESGKVFQVLDGLLLKDGYLYKKVSPESLSFWGVVPTEEEISKFGSSENNESNDMEWLSNIYGDTKKKRVITADKGDGKGEGSSGLGAGSDFELFTLVRFRKQDFGVIISTDKDGTYKILKESSEGPVAVTVQKNDIKSALGDLKLSAQDLNNKTVVVNDNVKVLEGPSQGKQGIVRYIYKGIVFLYDGNEEENSGYVAAKATMCEKFKLAVGDFSGTGKDSEPGPLVFDDQPSSPRSPLSPKKPWQSRESDREFNRGDSDSLFAIGQTLRIRIGPLKGYLCRVTGIRRSDVTVKLDSQQKFLTVKSEHLSVVQGKNTAVSASGDPDSNSSNPFDLLGAEGGAGGWLNNIAGTSTGGGGWNTAGETSAERGGWGNSSAPSSVPDNAEDNAWGTKSTSTPKPSWGAAANTGTTSEPEQSGGWGNGGGSSGQADDGENTAWGTKSTSTPKPSWGAAANTGTTSEPEQSGGWGKGGASSGQAENDNQNTAWGAKSTSTPKPSWGTAANTGTTSEPEQSGGWGKGGASSGQSENDNQNTAWGAKSTSNPKPSWGTAANTGTTSEPEQSGGWGNGGGSSGQAVVNDGQNTAWGTKSTSKPSWGAAANTGTISEPEQSGGWGKGGGSSGQAELNDNQSTAWGTKSTSTPKPSWGAAANTGTASEPDQSGGWGKGGGGSGQAEVNDNQNTAWGNKSTSTPKPSWGAAVNTGTTSEPDQSGGWGKGGGTSNWSAGNSDPPTQDDGSGGRGGYRGRGGSDRGGFRGRGFRGRGESGGFGGRGDRGGFDGRGGSDGEGFGGRWGSDRGSGGGRGRGRNDRPGGWNNSRDSGEDGSSDWKKGADNVEGWKNNNGSGAWTSSSGGASGSWNSGGSGPVTEAKDSAGWAKGTDSGAGWAKGTDSAPDKGQSSSWGGSAADGSGGSWGKKNDGDSKGGW
ncbi:unnamed protein product [Trifolium pratense]|uniref:Uncharacterized protein n=1 Tax=Trifolium pratense TaxID=57577 RepID=A0ACB0IFK8_TRIPR|nr:unnamed protein product [Trifolium pratense]